MKKRAIILLHVFTWLFACFVQINNLARLKNPEMLISFLISMLFLVIPFYIFYFYIIPNFLEKKRIPAFFAVSGLTILTLPFLGYTTLLLNKAIFEQSFENFYKAYTLKMHLSGAFATLVASIFGSFLRVIINWFDIMNQKEISDKQRLLSEMALLKSKVNPHFLFNTLNNIDTLISQDPDKASNALLKLSEIMRYMSYETISEYTDLAAEIKYVESLTELYKLRVKNPECIKVEIPAGYPNLKVAPLLFVPFVENAFKYATLKGENAGISLKFEVKNASVFFTISNFYKASEVIRKRTGGTGIENVKKRLELSYPQRYQMQISDLDGQFIVALTIRTHD